MMKILLVEDEPDFGTALKDMLNQYNYLVYASILIAGLYNYGLNLAIA